MCQDSVLSGAPLKRHGLKPTGLRRGRRDGNPESFTLHPIHEENPELSRTMHGKRSSQLINMSWHQSHHLTYRCGCISCSPSRKCLDKPVRPGAREYSPLVWSTRQPQPLEAFSAHCSLHTTGGTEEKNTAYRRHIEHQCCRPSLGPCRTNNSFHVSAPMQACASSVSQTSCRLAAINPGRFMGLTIMELLYNVHPFDVQTWKVGGDPRCLCHTSLPGSLWHINHHHVQSSFKYEMMSSPGLRRNWTSSMPCLLD